MLNILKSFKKLFLIAITLYTLSIIFGYFIGMYFPIGEIDDNTTLTSNPFVYFNHNIVALLYFLSGLVTFGLGSIYNLLLNGTLLGVAIESLTAKTSFWVAILHILPHAVFEIPALLLAGGLGLLPIKWFYNFLKGNKRVHIRWIQLFKLGCVMICLLLLAGFSEAWLTPYIIKLIS
ncbi:stage II sporulation protein M [Bacillus gobiensis]|uniref:stage II sporulation protein M n=1 Tax=Bacillus gobiensis TaxID=1441095 RepID=UPI003D1C767E